MLSASEFSVGCLADASGLSIVLPRNKYEELCLVTSVDNASIAVCLNGDHRFSSFPCGENEAWKGLIVPGVSIEVDETSLFDADGRHPPLGAMLRKRTELCIVAKGENSMYQRTMHYPVTSGLPPCRDGMAAGFTRWQVVLWRGEETQIMKKIELTDKSSD